MRKALIVSNEISLADVTKRHIDHIGLSDLEVSPALTSDEAVEKLSYGDISFVVLDEDLEGGEAVAKTASGLDSKLLLITNDQNPQRFGRYSPVAYLEKPDYFNALRSEVVKLYPTLR